jgi:hypothetical protein
MALQIGSVQADVRIEVDQAVGSLRAVQDALRATGQASTAAGTSIQGAADRINQSFKGAGVGIRESLGAGLSQASAFARGQADEFVGSFRGALAPTIGATIGAAFGGAIAGAAGAAIQALSAQVNKFIDTGVAIGKLQQATGMAARDLSALSQIAAEGEVSFDTFRGAMTRFSRVIAETKGPSANMRMELMQLADRFAAMPDGPEKAALAMEMFGRQGEALIPILSQGSAALQDYASELEGTGAVMDDSMVAAANRADDAMDKLNRTGERLGIQFADKVVPAITVFGEAAALTMQQTERMGVAALNAGNFGSNMARAMSGAAQSMDAASASAQRLAGSLTVMSAAARQAVADYTALRAAEAGRAAGMNNVLSAGAALGNDHQKQADREEVLRGKIQLGNEAYYDRYRATQRADIEQRRLERGTQALTEADKELDAWLEQVNASLDGQTGGAGRAAKATKDLTTETERLADANKRLEERTKGIGSAMGMSLEPMSASQRFQEAWKIATGETTLAQLQQEAAVKGVMKALEAGSISQEDALATLLSLRAGLLDNKGAMEQAGDYAGQFSADVEAIRAVAEKSIEKVKDLSQGINTLPNSKTVSLGMQIIGKDDLLDAHTRWQAIQDRNVRLNVEILGMERLTEIWRGLFGGAPPIGTPSGTTTTTNPPGGTTTTTTDTDYGGDGGGGDRVRGSRQAVNVVFNGRVLASAMTDDTTVRGVRGNARRSYR